MEKEGSSFRQLIRDALYEGLKTMLGKIIAVIILVILLSRVPMIRDLFISYRDLTESRSEEVNPKAPEAHKSEEKRVEEIQRQPETQRQVQTKSETKRPAMSDVYFVELCKSGNVQEVEEAIKNYGANVNAKDNNGVTALMWAIINGYTDTAELLIKYGADVNAKDQHGDTALMMAADQGHTDIAELLIKYGADVNARNKYGKTALMWACNAKIKELLRRYGAK